MVKIEITFTDGTVASCDMVGATSLESSREYVAKWLDGKGGLIFGDLVVNRHQVKHVRVSE